MKKISVGLIIVAGCFVFNTSFAYINKNIHTQKKQINDSNVNQIIQKPVLPKGFFGSGTLSFLQAATSDGDSQYGTFLTLTPTPPTLRAVMQAVTPQLRPSGQLMLGYQTATK